MCERVSINGDIFERMVRERIDVLCLQEVRLREFRKDAFCKYFMRAGYEVASGDSRRTRGSGACFGGVATLYRAGVGLALLGLDKQRSVAIQLEFNVAG